MARQDNTINDYGQPLDSPINQQGSLPTPVVPWKYGINQKLQYKQGKFSRLNIKNPGTNSNQASLTSTIGAGSTQFITDTLIPQPPHGTEMNFAIPYVAVYEGTAATPNRQIYPILGGAQNYGSYAFQCDNDFNTFSTILPGSVISVFTMQIHNNMASPGTFFFVSQFKYLNFNTGTVQ